MNYENLFRPGYIGGLRIKNRVVMTAMGNGLAAENGEASDEIIACYKALAAGGLPVAEVTFRTDAAEEAIRRIKVEVPDVCVCAGTVLNVKTAERAVKAGASAIISPGTNPEVVRWCIAHRVPVIPGCATPTEVEACMRMGLDFVKLFPAEVVGGVKMLKALGGPYGNMKFMPTGGISAQNAAEYLALPNVLCCGGSWMVPGGLLDAGDFDAIEALAREAAQIVKK